MPPQSGGTGLNERPLQASLVESESLSIVVYDTAEVVGFFAVERAQQGWRPTAKGPAGMSLKEPGGAPFHWATAGVADGRAGVTVVYGVLYDQAITRVEVSWVDGVTQSITPSGHLFTLVSPRSIAPATVKALAGERSV